VGRPKTISDEQSTSEEFGKKSEKIRDFNRNKKKQQ